MKPLTGELREAMVIAECELLGAIIWASREYGTAPMDYLRGKLRPSDFHDHQYEFPSNRHSRIFRAMLECPIAHEGFVAKKLGELEILSDGDVAYLFKCTSLNCHMQYEEYAQIVLHYAELRGGKKKAKVIEI